MVLMFHHTSVIMPCKVLIHQVQQQHQSLACTEKVRLVSKCPIILFVGLEFLINNEETYMVQHTDFIALAGFWPRRLKPEEAPYKPPRIERKMCRRTRKTLYF